MEGRGSNVARYLPELAKSSAESIALRIPLPRSRFLFQARGNSAYLSLSYARVEALASGLAHVFASRGIGRGTRVLLMLRPGRDLILTVFALFKMGAVPVVIDPGMGLKSFRSCVARTRPQALVGIPLGQAVARVFRKDFSTAGVRITLGGRTGLGALLGGGFGEDRLEALVRGQPGHFEPVVTSSSDLAAILFTSGSTGAPKGVCYEHGMFEAQVQMVREAYGIAPGEVDLPLLPVFALFGPALGFTSVVPTMNPGKPASVDPAALVKAIEDNGVTNSFGSPVLWAKIANYCERTGRTLPTLRRVLMAGAPAHPTLLRRMRALLPQGEVHTPYGATEVLPVASISATEVLEQTAPLTQSGFGTCVGRLLPGVRARIIAIADTPLPTFAEAELLPPGRIGEIVVTGPSVTRTYDGLPEATTAAKILDTAEGSLWHRMGDAGTIDAEGRLWFCGRKVERVCTGGGFGAGEPVAAASSASAVVSSVSAVVSPACAVAPAVTEFEQSGVLYTDCVEGIMNAHPQVFRTALVGVGPQGAQVPHLMVEPWPQDWPASAAAEAALCASLRALAQAHAITRPLQAFHFRKRFPVDVRHNAKIHRLEMGRELSGH